MVKEITGGYKIKFHPLGGEEWEVDFTPPFRRLDIIEDLEKELGTKFPPATDFDKESTRQFFDKLCVEKGVECTAPRTTSRLLDKVRYEAFM